MQQTEHVTQKTVPVQRHRLFTGRVIGSLATFSVISALCLVWLVTIVIVPMATTPLKFTSTGIVSFGFDLLITGLILFALIHNSLDLITYAPLQSRKQTKNYPKVKIKRFSLNQRVQHVWMISTTGFSALTGFALMYYGSWGRDVANALGGFVATRNWHYVSAILMGILVVYHFGFYVAKYLTNKALKSPAPLDIMFTKKDISDFFGNIKFYLGMGPAPKFNKYTYSQRFDYWGIYWGMIILGAPGVAIWALGLNAFGGLAMVFHTKEALLAVLFLAAFHLYVSHFSPKVFPLDATFVTGSMSKQQMEEDHPLEMENLKIK